MTCMVIASSRERRWWMGSQKATAYGTFHIRKRMAIAWIRAGPETGGRAKELAKEAEFNRKARAAWRLKSSTTPIRMRLKIGEREADLLGRGGEDMGKKDSPPLPPSRQAVHLNCFCSRDDQSIIGIAVNPGLAWIEGLNNRMTGLTLVTAGMLIGGVITAANVATGQADAQVDPFGAHLHTFFTAGRAGIDIVDLSKV
jgi:hypothetical protein